MQHRNDASRSNDAWVRRSSDAWPEEEGAATLILHIHKSFFVTAEHHSCRPLVGRSTASIVRAFASSQGCAAASCTLRVAAWPWGILTCSIYSGAESLKFNRRWCTNTQSSPTWHSTDGDPSTTHREPQLPRASVAKNLLKSGCRRPKRAAHPRLGARRWPHPAPARAS